MIVDDTIATIYVDGVALNARAYKRPGESLSLFVSEGSLKVTNCKVTTGLRIEPDSNLTDNRGAVIRCRVT